MVFKFEIHDYPENWSLLQTMEGHKRAILCMVMANRVMYTGSADVSARCWVREFGECSKLYKGHQNAVVCLKFYKGICEFM